MSKTKYRELVELANGENFLLSVFVREDGPLFSFNETLLDRIARAGKLPEFCDKLKIMLEEELHHAQKSRKRFCGAIGNLRDSLPRVQKSD